MVVSEEDVEQAWQQFLETFDEEYSDRSIENKIATIAEKAAANYADTWEEAYHGIAKVVYRFGREASKQCGEPVKDLEDSDEREGEE